MQVTTLPVAFLIAFISFLAGGGFQADQASDDGRRPVPSRSDCEQRLQACRQAHRDQFSRTASRDKVELARFLHEAAQQFKDDPVGRYVYLEEARRLSLEAGSLLVALDAIEDLGSAFQVQVNRLRVDAVQAASQQGALEGADVAAERILRLLDEVLIEGHLQTAQDVLGAARDIKNKIEAGEVRGRWDATNWLVERRRDVENARLKLDKDPRNAICLEKVGRYLCLVEYDFERGLPMLALVTSRPRDMSLRRLVEKELAAPTEAGAQEALGDAWLKMGESGLPPMERRGACLRAIHWYERVAPQAEGKAQGVEVAVKVARARGLLSAPMLEASTRLRLGSGVAGAAERGEATISRVTIDIGANRVAAFEYFQPAKRGEDTLVQRILVRDLEDGKADREFADHWREKIRSHLLEGSKFDRKVVIVVTRPHHPADHSLGTGNRCQWTCQLEGGQAKLSDPCRAGETRGRRITR